ncbi:MAG: hypothetical protein ACKO3G_04315 [Planctomycetaceae bacterium]
MAKRKKTVAQRAVGLAAPVMPAPVAKVVGTRWGARLFLLLLPFLLATGIITISWTNGLPMVSFDWARALVVGRRVGEDVGQKALDAAQDLRGQDLFGREAEIPASQGWGEAQPTAWQQAPTQWQPQPASPQPFPGQPQQAAQPAAPRAYR